MLRQLESSLLLQEQFPKGLFLPLARIHTISPARRNPRPLPITVQNFPRRPDAGVINESIPLFYIGQNRKGRWVVRESEGRSGGLFLFKQWAIRFARRESEPSGCAIMFLAEPVELEINSDGKCAGSLVPVGHSSHRERSDDGVVAMLVAAWRKLKSYIAHNSAAQRRNREAIERDLFGGQYRLNSKNDDDLPAAL
jgi:hypothetical protein